MWLAILTYVKKLLDRTYLVQKDHVIVAVYPVTLTPKVGTPKGPALPKGIALKIVLH